MTEIRRATVANNNRPQQMVVDARGVIQAWGKKPGVKGEVAALLSELLGDRETWEKAFEMHECGCEPSTCNLFARAQNVRAGWPEYVSHGGTAVEVPRMSFSLGATS